MADEAAWFLAQERAEEAKEVKEVSDSPRPLTPERLAAILNESFEAVERDETLAPETRSAAAQIRSMFVYLYLIETGTDLDPA